MCECVCVCVCVHAYVGAEVMSGLMSEGQGGDHSWDGLSVVQRGHYASVERETTSRAEVITNATC